MNTISLVLNGRTAADIALLPERQRATLTTLPPSNKRRNTSQPSSPFLSPSKRTNNNNPRPTAIKRQLSRDSPGWYNTDGGMTLDDFAARLNTTLAKLEQFQGRCAQNVVMALMRPTPIALFIFNPVSLLVWVGLLVWWVSARFSSAAVVDN